jgi:hypothetical protein
LSCFFAGISIFLSLNIANARAMRRHDDIVEIAALSGDEGRQETIFIFLVGAAMRDSSQ